MRKLVLFFFLLFVLTGLQYSTPPADAQGWRLFTNKIKSDKKKEKSGETAPPEEQAPPLFDDSKNNVDLDAVSEPEESNAPAAPANHAAPGPKGMLDFSDALGDDASDSYGYAEDENDEPPTFESNANFAESLPSYRNFPEQKADARLNDVCFIDASTGWAVGDRGTILRTKNGGAEWTLLDSTTDVNLFAVSFFDENYGLAVGGRVLPSTHVGQGVVLRTVDGGDSWVESATPSFPILRDVKIVDEENAWIAGDASNLYPSGLFFSADTGIEWTSVEGNKRDGWRVALYDPIERLGIGVTNEGKVQSVDGDEAKPSSLSLGTRRVKDVAYDPSDNRAWIVGDQGLALNSVDFGANWAQTPGGLPNEAENYFDLEAVAARDGFVGAVGSPGSLFFYSDDAGATWNASRTGVKTPLRKLCFVDRNVGWAVGDLGTIAATVDGGKTWTTQRAGAQRAALLGVLGRAEDVPLEALVQLAGDEGYLVEFALVAREANKEGLSEEIPLTERLNEALVETGAAGLTQANVFILNPAEQRDSIEQILRRFDEENDGDGLARFRERLVRLIRIWRPSALLTIDSTLEDGVGDVGAIPNKLDPSKPDGAKALVGALAANAASLDARPRDAFQELLLRELPAAIKNAADPAAYPEHLTACGLEPWAVKKARLLCRGQTQGNMTIDSSYYCASLGRPIAEIAANARAIVSGSAQTKDSTNFQTLFCAAVPKHADKTFFDGLELPYASDARRARQTGLAARSDALAARAGDRRQKLGVVDAAVRKRGDLLLSQLRGNIQGADPEFAVEYLENVGRRFAKLGEWAAAEEAFSLVALELIDVPQSREALTWLAQYYSGSETERRVVTQGETSVDDSRIDRLENAQKLGDSIREIVPETFMSPEVRFPLAAAQARKGDLAGAMRFYQARSEASSGDVWAVRAAAEYWLRAPSTDVRSVETKYCPLSMFAARRLPGRPYLDGVLEPDYWENAQRLDLSTPFQGAPSTREPTLAETAAKNWREKNKAFSRSLGTTVSIGYDSQFLYIGAACQKASGYDYAASSNGATLSNALSEAAANSNESEDDLPRGRDADLSSYDRVEFQFDLDGDYTTAYRFVFDCRGWAFDSNWNDPTWNPGLFVAKAETETAWTIEAAIPLAELTDHTPNPGEVWRAAVKRVTPGVGVECWNVENSDAGKDAFGLMSFD